MVETGQGMLEDATDGQGPNAIARALRSRSMRVRRRTLSEKILRPSSPFVTTEKAALSGICTGQMQASKALFRDVKCLIRHGILE